MQPVAKAARPALRRPKQGPRGAWRQKPAADQARACHPLTARHCQNARSALDCGSPLPLCAGRVSSKAPGDWRSPKSWRPSPAAGDHFRHKPLGPAVEGAWPRAPVFPTQRPARRAAPWTAAVFCRFALAVSHPKRQGTGAVHKANAQMEPPAAISATNPWRRPWRALGLERRRPPPTAGAGRPPAPAQAAGCLVKLHLPPAGEAACPA